MKIHQYPNHLTTVIEKISGIHSASIGLWVKVGGRYENKEETGLSHFLEHLVFKGTFNRSCKQIKKDIEGIGGEINAFTGKEYTCFYVKVPADATIPSVNVLTDMVFEPLLSEKDIENEKLVVVEEINMYLDTPSRRIDECLDKVLWENHPLGKSLTGSQDNVRSFCRENCLQFIQKYYQPINMVLSIAGNIDETKLSSQLTMLNSLKKNRPSSSSSLVPYKIKNRQLPIEWVIQDIEQTHLSLGFYSYSRKNPLRYALNLLSIVLGGNMSSRLFEELRENKGWVYDIHSSCSYYQDTGSFDIYAGLDSKKLLSSLHILQRELSKIKNDLISSEELKRAKAYYKGQLCISMEKTTARMSYNAEKLLNDEKIETLDPIFQKIESVTQQDVLKVAQDIFQKEKLIIVGLSKNNPSYEVRTLFDSF